jgi:hypothetical protein
VENLPSTFSDRQLGNFLCLLHGISFHQKALDQMNIQLHHVISDLTGTTGLAIVDAILSGERDPAKLAKLRDPHILALGKGRSWTSTLLGSSFTICFTSKSTSWIKRWKWRYAVVTYQGLADRLLTGTEECA